MMQITKPNIESFKIHYASDLDPITVFLQEEEKGHGRLTIACFSESWTYYWSGLGDRTLKLFLKEADVGYLVDKLSKPKDKAKEIIYLSKIVEAIKESLLSFELNY